VFASQVKLPEPLDGSWGIQQNWSEADATISKADGIHMSLRVASLFKGKLDSADLELEVDKLLQAELAGEAIAPAEDTQVLVAGEGGLLDPANPFQTPVKLQGVKRGVDDASLQQGLAAGSGVDGSEGQGKRQRTPPPPAGSGGKASAPPA
jgi:hypothetical protein